DDSGDDDDSGNDDNLGDDDDSGGNDSSGDDDDSSTVGSGEDGDDLPPLDAEVPLNTGCACEQSGSAIGSTSPWLLLLFGLGVFRRRHNSL
ncbi:MAG: hypothetical protein CL928_18255, partial [Deltaproteobacteria bacterium]|nr:hypothetical protein [Deltaproteobacteria bacterium]